MIPEEPEEQQPETTPQNISAEDELRPCIHYYTFMICFGCTQAKELEQTPGPGVERCGGGAGDSPYRSSYV